jgi:hypothetical protein
VQKDATHYVADSKSTVRVLYKRRVDAVEAEEPPRGSFEGKQQARTRLLLSGHGFVRSEWYLSAPAVPAMATLFVAMALSIMALSPLSCQLLPRLPS